MSKKIAFVFVAIAAVFLIFLVDLFVAVLGDHVERRESISRKQATSLIDFPFVDSATNIYFYEKIGGLQSLDRFIRFQVSMPDITNQLNLMISDDNHRFNRNLSYARTNIVLSEIPQSPPLHWWNKPISWWTPGKITNGYYVGAINGYAFQIWVDENSGTLFINQGD